MEWIAPLLPTVSVVIGGLITYLAVYSTQRLIQNREKMQYLHTKLERVYMLTQDLYDGHKAEIDKLALSDNVTASDWFKSREHPGKTMNEIKMTVAMYAPKLQGELDAINAPHQALKSGFVRIDEEFQSGASTAASRSTAIKGLRVQLTYLGTHLNELKRKLAAQAASL